MDAVLVFEGVPDADLAYTHKRLTPALRTALQRPDVTRHLEFLRRELLDMQPRVVAVGVPLPVAAIQAVLGGDPARAAVFGTRTSERKAYARAAKELAQRVNLFQGGGTSTHILLVYSTARGGFKEMLPLLTAPLTVLHDPRLAGLLGTQVSERLVFSTDLCDALRGAVSTILPRLEGFLAHHTDSALFAELEFTPGSLKARMRFNTGRALVHSAHMPWVAMLLNFAAQTVDSGFFGDDPPLIVSIILSESSFGLAGVRVAAEENSPESADAQ